MASTNKYAVDPIGKSPQYMQQVNPGRAHHPDEPYMRGVLKTGNTAKVGTPVAAPVAYDAYHFWLIIMVRTHFSKLKTKN
jgi:hypothetical protein